MKEKRDPWHYDYQGATRRELETETPEVMAARLGELYQELKTMRVGSADSRKWLKLIEAYERRISDNEQA